MFWIWVGMLHRYFMCRLKVSEENWVKLVYNFRASDYIYRVVHLYCNGKTVIVSYHLIVKLLETVHGTPEVAFCELSISTDGITDVHTVWGKQQN